jgi:AraC-like DNA-binding protein
MVGFRDCGAAGLDIRVTAMPMVTMVIQFGESDLVIDSNTGRRVSTGFVSRFPSGTMRIRSERAECVEVRLSPALATSLFRVPPADLGYAIVDVEDLWGRRARRLREQLADAATWEERFALTRSFLARGEESAQPPHPEVVASWDRILASRGQVRVDELAESCGWSRKRLWARFESEIGLTPKRAVMLVRFRHAVERLLAGGSIADIAVACGYADQSHLCRDMSSFADLTPGAVADETLSAVAKHRYQTWGTFFQYRA